MSYEAFAYYYDSLMDQNFYNDYIQFINEHVKDYQTVLELGCGTGEIAIRLAHLGKQVCATSGRRISVHSAKPVFSAGCLPAQRERGYHCR